MESKEPFDPYEKEDNAENSRLYNIRDLAVKEILIKKLSQELQVPLYIVKAVVENQFKTAQAALPKYVTIELSGFGKFIFREKRARGIITIYENSIAKYEMDLQKPTISEVRKIAIEGNIRNMKEGIAYLVKKLNKINNIYDGPEEPEIK